MGREKQRSRLDANRAPARWADGPGETPHTARKPNQRADDLMRTRRQLSRRVVAGAVACKQRLLA